MTTQPHEFDTLDFIMRWEDGQCDDAETIRGFQALIDSGMAWRLQGAYGRMASNLIENGLCRAPGERLH